MTTKTLFSGIQPSGNLHLGNYLGAISKWLEMTNDYRCLFCVVDYHAITVPQDPKTYKAQIRDIAKIYLASGIDPNKAIIFQQSDIKEHAELAWLLNCSVARISDLNKMTQFKDKAKSKSDNVSVGLYDYPVLMAADILLYDTDVVPVGDDQLQHVELCRTLARRFNSGFSETFKIPEAVLRKEGARIMGLDDPSKKMSKSATSPANYIALSDEPEVARKKIMRAVTDSGSELKYDKSKKPAIANLLTIYSLLANKTIKELEKQYEGQGYGQFKKDLAEVVVNFLKDFQKKYNQISDKQVDAIFKASAEVLRPLAEKKVEAVKKAMGM